MWTSNGATNWSPCCLLQVQWSILRLLSSRSAIYCRLFKFSKVPAQRSASSAFAGCEKHLRMADFGWKFFMFGEHSSNSDECTVVCLLDLKFIGYSQRVHSMAGDNSGLIRLGALFGQFLYKFCKWKNFAISLTTMIVDLVDHFQMKSFGWKALIKVLELVSDQMGV